MVATRIVPRPKAVGVDSVRQYGLPGIVNASDVQNELFDAIYRLFFVGTYSTSFVSNDVLIPVNFHNLFIYKFITSQPTVQHNQFVVSSYELDDTLDLYKSNTDIEAFEDNLAQWAMTTGMVVDENYDDDESAVDEQASLIDEFLDKYKDEAKRKYGLVFIVGDFKTDTMSNNVFGIYSASHATGVQGLLWQDSGYYYLPVKFGSGLPGARKPIKMSEDELKKIMSKYSSFQAFNEAVYIPQQDLIERFIRRIIRV